MEAENQARNNWLNILDQTDLSYTEISVQQWSGIHIVFKPTKQSQYRLHVMAQTSQHILRRF